MIGNCTDIVRTFEGKYRVTFEVDSIDELNGLTGLIKIVVKKLTQRRSLNANAYFHVLVGKIAEELHVSKAKAKNMLLGKYGQREINEQGQVIISAYDYIDLSEREDIHCVPVGYANLNGKDFTHWAVIRGSHTYDNLEMAALIDGTVEEAKELGIPTETPDEIARIKALWANQ
jgi:hypothetical protein